MNSDRFAKIRGDIAGGYFNPDARREAEALREMLIWCLAEVDRLRLIEDVARAYASTTFHTDPDDNMAIAAAFHRILHENPRPGSEDT